MISTAAIAFRLAAESTIPRSSKVEVKDQTHNTTRFIILTKNTGDTEPGNGPLMTLKILFRVRNHVRQRSTRRSAAL